MKYQTEEVAVLAIKQNGKLQYIVEQNGDGLKLWKVSRGRMNDYKDILTNQNDTPDEQN